MTSKLAAKAGKKLFERNLKDYTPVDPLYETYIDSKGRERRRKRELPPGLSARDAKILKAVKKRAHYLDKGFNMCGMRFGWTFIIGIIPGAGDVADAVLNYLLVVRKARQAELPAWLIRRMLFNNAVSASVGLIPLLGDVILAAYKANSRNAALLEEFLRIRGEEFIKRERDRVEDPNNVKPGAGREAGEIVSGKPVTSTPDSKKSTGSGWFKRKSNGNGSPKGKGKEVTAVADGNRGSRFVEDVGSEGSGGASKAKKV
ncbi:hypothetical protein BXZ70DRAFT_935743 [Cristinia sonorae]|uniref:Ph domain-containing protein n=1 Tax=Cristinia sonorae TaxID=1940300 RepID=A0A8K0XQK7_9AGAR|nr:hypothetical protein BXZ70DRAFT_935743 [Cristinia sonorae]